ncbi:hypothetical protein ACLX1H_004914 [Fusarium chlamydosporum]
MSNTVSTDKPVDHASAGPSSPKSAGESTDQQSRLLPPQHWAELSEDIEDQDDGDSTIPENASSTASLTSSILQYRTVNGRLYQSERGNTDYWHVKYLSKVRSYTNNTTPPMLMYEDIKTAVDIGTGTDIWAIHRAKLIETSEFADKFPNASVIGTDLAPIQPSWVPPNLEFRLSQMEDCTQEWTIAPNSLDYVHMRWLIGSIAHWTDLFKEAYRSLKPGGWVESYEPSSTVESDDNTVLPGSAMSQWQKFFVEGGRKIGRPFTVFDDDIQRKAMQEAGFVDIEERNFKVRLYLPALRVVGD